MRLPRMVLAGALSGVLMTLTFGFGASESAYGYEGHRVFIAEGGVGSYKQFKPSQLLLTLDGSVAGVRRPLLHQAPHVLCARPTPAS